MLNIQRTATMDPSNEDMCLTTSTFEKATAHNAEDSMDALTMSSSSDDDDESCYYSIEEGSAVDVQPCGVPPLPCNESDLTHSIKGMYRIFDLISEPVQDSDSFVDRIITSDDSLEAFINSVCLGACESISNVDFNALDKHVVKPVGVYGSKEAIVQFLLELDSIDMTIAAQLLDTESVLRSGLYVIVTPTQERIKDFRQIFVLYWPEKTTWDDSCKPSVRRNRILFMRYLTKMCDQVVALISQEHAQTIIWNEDNDSTSDDDDILRLDDDQLNQLFTFEVTRINQEESVSVSKGFEVCSLAITRPETPDQDRDATKPTPIAPFLLLGETRQGFMTVEYKEARAVEEVFKGDPLTTPELENFLLSDRLQLNEKLSEEAVRVLVHSGVETRFPKAYAQWKQAINSVRNRFESLIKFEIGNALAKLELVRPALQRSLFDGILDEVLRVYSCFNRTTFVYEGSVREKLNDPKPLSELLKLYPNAKDIVMKQLSKDFRNIPSNEFQTARSHIGLIKELLRKKCSEREKEKYARILNILSEGDAEQWTGAKLSQVVASGADWSAEDKELVADLVHRAVQAETQISDGQFLNQLEQDVEKYMQDLPQFRTWVDRAKLRAFEYLQSTLTKTVKKLTPLVHRIRGEECAAQIRREHSRMAEEEQGKLRASLIKQINDVSTQTAYSHSLSIDDVEEISGWYSSTYRISGSRTSHHDAVMVYTVNTINLTTQNDNPNVSSSLQFMSRHTFKLPLGHSIVQAQLLEEEKLLLVIADSMNNLTVYLDRLTALDDMNSYGGRKKLDGARIGCDVLLAYDESRKMLAILSDKVLHFFVFDSEQGFQAWGSATNLQPWYSDELFIRFMCFVSGKEEVLLVDSQAQARIFSQAALQLQPATLQLDQVPYSVCSTPDGACLLVAQAKGSDLSVTAYHWSSFGSTEGILLDLGSPCIQGGFVATSLINRTVVHIVQLDFEVHAFRSHALEITQKASALAFVGNGPQGPSMKHGVAPGPVHNCLIDCHADIWSSFPVVPAVERDLMYSSSLRRTQMLIFVTDHDRQRYASYVAKMILTFEDATKKPTGDVLKSIQVSAVPFSVFADELCGDRKHYTRSSRDRAWSISAYHAGEWIAKLLSLIPIHLAVSRNGQFVPLKDGVYSPEPGMLSFDVDGINQIVDDLSFGWYESLFQSYMVSKQVKVVSSIGERSVGKSFALNHLVDTSFAGSAMRVPDGVWLSVAPTKDVLIVALDFKGVHRKSTQEYTLLLLFVIAISNLTLFHSNFVISQEITEYFRSIQLSSAMLSPQANWPLFQSALVINIKDIFCDDQSGIIEELFLEFQRVVDDKQDANFISKLHSGKLNIIPWPVNDSKEFYMKFFALKRRLAQQSVTHQSAQEFLLLMKILMAELKGKDWAPISQTTASHRVQAISKLLPVAFAFGYLVIGTGVGPLKNMDTNEPIDLPDTPHQLFIGTEDNQSTFHKHILTTLRVAWDGYLSRQRTSEDEWFAGLGHHLETIVKLRITHVREWLDQNLSRFRTVDDEVASHACMDELNDRFENLKVDLMDNIQLCGLMCAVCQLRCVQVRSHEGVHDCLSGHICVLECGFCLALEPVQHRLCTMSAGHDGNHICSVDQHLCRKSCMYSGKGGCLEVCTKVVNHADEEHRCAAPVHACGKACDLSDVRLTDGSLFSCSGTCQNPAENDHAPHQCNDHFCPIQCQLCKRLCIDKDHMHGLNSGATHLCGQEHLCTALCSAPGICQVETVPSEAVFTAKSKFQHVKYSHVAKRLTCVKSIQPYATEHMGPHSHSLDKGVIHFCEMRCYGCGYFCMLPLGHPQKEHETRHGLMTRARWVTDNQNASLEIEEREFGIYKDTLTTCDLVCSEMGRHLHVDDCRAVDETTCTGNEELQHVTSKSGPSPDRPKDLLTHRLFWKRNGFKDPYSKEEQANFAKCDAACKGPEHIATDAHAAIPSYCVLPIFHAPLDPNADVPEMGHISSDGHKFVCRNPLLREGGFHVIFVIERSDSMSSEDRTPLLFAEATARITDRSNNRYGAVLSSLHAFWSVRAAAISAANLDVARRDTYSVLLFNNRVVSPVVNDASSTPDQLLDTLLSFSPAGGSNVALAIQRAQKVMGNNWSAERPPVIILLSDGGCSMGDEAMQNLCRAAVQLGRAVSFHAILFGRARGFTSPLRQLVDIALDAQKNAPRDPLSAPVLSSYRQASNTAQLVETFLGIAESLRVLRSP